TRSLRIQSIARITSRFGAEDESVLLESDRDRGCGDVGHHRALGAGDRCRLRAACAALALHGPRPHARRHRDPLPGPPRPRRGARRPSSGPRADVLLVGCARRGRSTDLAAGRAVARARQRVNLDMKVRLWMLGTIGATAPFVGLYGTVVGIMAAFRSISEHGG